MKAPNLRIVLVTCLVSAVAASAALAAEPATPAAYCKSLRQTSPLLFGAGATYKNLGACVSAQYGRVVAERHQRREAMQGGTGRSGLCGRSWRQDVQQFYGTNTKAKGAGAGKNAFGKCVSQKAQSGTAGTAECGAERGKEMQGAARRPELPRESRWQDVCAVLRQERKPAQCVREVRLVACEG